jgi:hypothetical protein
MRREGIPHAVRRPRDASTSSQESC